MIQVYRWYRTIAQHWLQVQAATDGEIRLILDGTKIGASHQLLMIALAFRRRSLTVALRAYRRRAWIEEMFGDIKGNGFDLESTHLHSFIRLSRLTLVVILLYDWLATTGVKSIKAGLRHLVDRKDRRDLSIFQIGWRIINRRLINGQPIPIPLFPAANPKVSGS